jgi:signal-transduction protein with cAMP-binding, CBS, and nucleotidyltransferase domain
MRDGNKTFPITVSLGVTSRTSDVKGPEELLNQADEAMLVAKRQGRNRVVAFSDFHRLATDSLDSGHAHFRAASAADIMTPVLVHLTRLHSLQEAARLLLCLRLDSVPVIDDEGRTLGIIGEEDLTAQILSDRGWQQSVGDVMNTTPVTYDVQTPAVEICDFLSRVTVRRVIILQAGRPVGLISRSTLIRWLRNASLTGPDDSSKSADASVLADDVTERLRSTIDRLTSQIAALQQRVEYSQGAVTPVVVSAATRIQELVDDALMLTADQDADSVAGYATMGAVLS